MYAVDVHLSYFLNTEFVDWCIDHNIEYTFHSGPLELSRITLYFNEKKDITLFKLRWD